MNPTRTKPRFVAIDILNEILGNKKSFHELKALGILKNLKPNEKAFVQRLVMDTLRNLDRCDRLLEKYLKKDPKLKVKNILRLGVTELVTGGASHAIVNEAVSYAASNKITRPMKGLVNAVLRKLSSYETGDWNKYESISRLPEWLRGPLINAYGKSAVIEIEKIQSLTPPIDITLKDPSKIHNWAKALEGRIVFQESIRLESGRQISALPGFKEGDWWVQDTAASIPVRLLENLSGKKVLDLCAAPGAKTLQLASLGAAVTAVDISANRLELLKDNLDRCELTANVIESDAFNITDKFDIILLDAPCSATGTIRRHPDLVHCKDGSNFFELIEIQSKLLDHASSILEDNGLIVYATCSLLPDEGECQIEEFLDRNDQFIIKKPNGIEKNIPEAWVLSSGDIRITPASSNEEDGLDGFYICYLQKKPNKP
jgi:16S rRNA (cytosine967-C5)-methyltransferase